MIIMDYIETWKDIVQRPSNFYKNVSTVGGFADPLTFAVISYFIYGLLTAFSTRGMSMGGISGAREFNLSMMLIFVISMPILGIVFLFIGGAILYMVYKLLGGTGSYEGTVIFMSYATAVTVVSWIPFIGWIIGTYGIYLNIIGGTFIHNISMGKSAIAVIIDLILLTILGFLMAMALVNLAFVSDFVI
jgi:hypothetical protein